MSLIFVDCEAYGPCPSLGQLTEFGAVEYPNKYVFYRRLVETTPDPKIPAIPIPKNPPNPEVERKAFLEFEHWLKYYSDGKPTFVSDNPAYDWQWINDYFHRYVGSNPFGFSARRIGDFYAGLRNDFQTANEWKRLRKTKHTHNPADDAMGNLEAFDRMLHGER